MENSLATTLVLICAASTRSSRIGGFPAPEEPLDEAGRRVSEFALEARFRGKVAIGPMLSARESARAIGVEGPIEPALADIDYGRWTGRSFEEVHAAEAEALAAWLADPTTACPGGETMAAVEMRVGCWLDAVAAREAPICAITHPMVIRAALARALGLPPRATLAIDIAPLSRTTLSHNRHWRLQSIVPRS
jgi:broad specificity phosphatase PhoE